MAVVIGAITHGVRSLSGLWQKGALGVVAVVLIVLGMLTWRQASVYRDDETFNRHIIALNPQARDAHLNLSKALYEQGRYEEALEAARVAVEQRPDFFDTHANLGGVLTALERFDEAEPHLRHAIALNPQGWHAHLNLGKILAGQGRYGEALEATRVAVEQRPDVAVAHAILGIASAELGRFNDALQHFDQALSLDPTLENVRATREAMLKEMQATQD